MPLTVVNDRGHVMTTFERGTPEAPLQEFILRVPGYDHRHGPEAKPGGGVHSEEIALGVRRPHPEDPTRSVALVLTVCTGVYPMTVPPHVVNGMRPGSYPNANDLTLHEENSLGIKGFGYYTEGDACCFFAKPAFCTRPFTTSLALDHLIGTGTNVGLRNWPAERWGTPQMLKEQFWVDLRGKLDRLLRDPDFFKQPDEPPALVAARQSLKVTEAIHGMWVARLADRQKRVEAELAKFKESRKS